MGTTSVILEGPQADAKRQPGFRRGAARAMLGLCGGLLPPDPAVPQGPERVAVALLAQARLLSPIARLLFFWGLHLMEWSPWLLLQAPSRLSSLPAGRRKELLERWLHSRIYLRRQLGIAYSGTIFMCYYDLPEVQSLLGYRIGPHLEESLARREALLQADLEAGREAPRAPSMIRR